MTSPLRRLQYCLVLVSLFAIARGGARLGASPDAVILCTQLCGTSADCGTECFNNVNGESPFWQTCGEFGGGGAAGWCLGTCGDGYCNPDNSEYYGEESCGSDCGYCGDGIVQWPDENQYNCPQDAHYCGDKYCNGYNENCSTCAYDCGGCPGPYPGGDDNNCRPGSTTCEGCNIGNVVSGTGQCCEAQAVYSGEWDYQTCENVCNLGYDEHCVILGANLGFVCISGTGCSEIGG